MRKRILLCFGLVCLLPFIGCSVKPIKIEFRLLESGESQNDYIFSNEVLLSLQDVDSAEVEVYKTSRAAGVSLDPSPLVNVNFQLTEEGAEKLSNFSTKYVNRRLGIFIDDKFISAPIIREPITGGVFICSAGFSEKEANRIVSRINSGKKRTNAAER